MVKVYLAARYSRRDEMCEVALKLEELGIKVTSRWLAEQEPLTSNMGDHSDAFYIETAKIDLQDIDAADALVFFSEDPLIGVPRGGRHVEFGYALGTGKPIYVVGPKENVFHYIKGVKHANNLATLINQLSVDWMLEVL